MKKRGKNQGKSKKKRNKRLILLLNMTKESFFSRIGVLYSLPRRFERVIPESFLFMLKHYKVTVMLLSEERVFPWPAI